jgi:hypothetical protein
METIADGLPEARHRRRTSRVLAFLEKAFARHVFLHEKCLFPLVRSLVEHRGAEELVLRQLEFEHAADGGLVVEIASAFAGQPEPQTLGYLLRAFFEHYRRHCVWERTVLYPLARKLLVNGAPRGQHEALLRMSLGQGASDGFPLAAAW